MTTPDLTRLREMEKAATPGRSLRCSHRRMVQSNSLGTRWAWCPTRAKSAVNGRAFCTEHSREKTKDPRP